VASGGGKKGKKSKQGPPPQVSPARQNKPRRHHLRVEGQNAMTPLAGGGTSSSLVIPSPSRARSLRKASTLSRSARSGVGEPCRRQPVPWPPPPILSRPTTIAGLCRPDLPEANVEFTLSSYRELIWSHKWKSLLFETEAASTTRVKNLKS
jgi:hypothetical protein